jgi:hypothetical protein
LIRNVMVLDFRPPGIPSNWEKTSVLVEQFRAAMRVVCKSQLIYQVVRHEIVIDFPVLEDGRRYSPESYQETLQNDQAALRTPNGAYVMCDYRQLIEKHRIIDLWRIDEVWMFGGPYFGFFESRMVGRAAAWCNAPGLEMDCSRFVMMGFSYERGVREMIHNFGHRAESLISQQFHSSYVYELYRNPNIVPPVPCNEFEYWLLDHGTVHRKPGGEDYGQDERAWLAALKAEWWPLAIDPNRV